MQNGLPDEVHVSTAQLDAIRRRVNMAWQVIRDGYKLLTH